MDSMHTNNLKVGGKVRGERNVTIAIFSEITKQDNLRVYILGIFLFLFFSP